ncbi:MAG TPA: cytochrome c biogenesis protein CcsA [Blastocatellia bacterium]|jgi:ABC-type transport system involved in cytochrome c biogenesis permease subunit|nr:cytochrome c biogenesis protein CcsA [Blastocatellia bacterium]
MGQAIKSINAAMSATEAAAPQIGLGKFPFANFLPAILPVAGALLILVARIKVGGSALPSDGRMVIWALLCYIFAAAALTTNFWAPIGFLQRLGLWTGSLGLFFNLSGWLMRWVEAGDRESWIRITENGKTFFSYIPLTNLYDYSVAFAFGAAFTTLLISNRPNTRFLGAISFPLITLVLLMAVFIGSHFVNLPPVLDSYWRSIHVGVASLSYGIALISFALAVVYLIKDGVKPETFGVAVTAFFIAGYVVVWLMGGFKAFDPLTFSYGLNPVLAGPEGVTNIAARIPLPGAGLFHALSLLTLIGMAVCFLLSIFKNNEGAGRIGHWLLRGSLVFQIVTIGLFFYHVKTMTDVGSMVGRDQYYQIGYQLMPEGNDGRSLAIGQPAEDVIATGERFMSMSGGALTLDLRGNPVEIAALFAMLVATGFVALIGFRSEKLRANLPALEKIDSMIYKTVGVAFAGLAILLVTGAVWANESWGRYWGWDSKETGALVAWLSYAGYLHTRIAHGWSGRRSAYFALIGFLLVIFTYLGVSFILPGLHSYAKL